MVNGMTREEAADILDPETSTEALNRYGPDAQARQQAIHSACVYAADALRGHVPKKVIINKWGLPLKSSDIFLIDDMAVSATDLNLLSMALPYVVETALTEQQREYFMAYAVDGMTLVEIADEEDVQKSTVWRTLHRAFDNLYDRLRYTAPIFYEAKQNPAAFHLGKETAK
jgi:DNA-binding CsgD family transcriptional regulator